MADTEDKELEEKLKMDPNDLYKEEVYMDRKIGLIRCLIPVKATGEKDDSRKAIFTGEAQIMTQVGPVPINFEIEAEDLAGAVAVYAQSAKAGIEKTVEQLKELRRQEASKLVVPGQAGFNPPGTSGSGLVMP